jgi:two-component system sensor histidine kinase YesM
MKILLQIRDYFKTHVIVRMTMTVMAVLLILIMIMQNVFQTYSMEQLQKEVLDREERNVGNVSDKVQLSLNTYLEVLYDLATENEINNILVGLGDSEVSLYNEQQITRTIKRRLIINNYMLAVKVVNEEGDSFGYDKAVLYGSTVTQKEARKSELEKLYSEVTEKKGPCFARSSMEDIVYIGVPMLWVKQGYQILVMELNLNFLHDMFQKMSSEGVRYYLKDEDNNVLMCADKEYIGKKINEKGEKLSVDAELKKENWTVLAVIDKDILTQDSRKLFDLFNMLWTILVMGVGVLLIITLRHAVKPLWLLISSMHDVGRGQFGIRIPVKGEDEIWQVVEQFNKMSIRLERYEERNRQQNEEKLKMQKLHWQTEMEVLESYINSHFIFNTLNFINYRAIEQGNHDISILIKKLSNIMRYAFNNQLKCIYLYQEIMWLEQYLYLQEICMEGKLSFDISLDDEIVSWPFRKMLLQPFVENSIIHGIKPRGGRGFILVSASKLKEGWIVITISDNGQGMTEEEKKEIQEKLDHPEGKREGGIGLSNVANRIYHFFGREAQIRVESEPDQGTKFILTLPYPKNREIMLKEENEESEDEWNEIY